ncbi:hypothetical protein [Luteimonas aquatica]|uniref:hypothetical protein n=1 Tax=Luteimonas aquatica TaxID=450364 RepID=UPI001F589AE9|nr:hypothetical protein [Luteimonas aquatica]
MRMIVPLLLAACSLADTAHARAEPPTRYLELTNRAHDSIASLAIAAAGGDGFRELAIDAPLRGGGEAVTVAVAGEGCRYDLRVAFRDGRTRVYRDFDLCRHRGLRVLPSPRGDGRGR